MRPYMRSEIRRADSRGTDPEMIAASKIPVPVAESRLKLKTALSMCGAATTGGTFCTSSCSPATGTFAIQMPSSDSTHLRRPPQEHEER